MTNSAEFSKRPLYSRDDLDQLKQLDRAGVLRTLGSFDENELSEDEFILRAAELLDAGRVPGLEQAQTASDAEGVLSSVLNACQDLAKQRSATEIPKAAPELLTAAGAVLKNRFTFYEETHQLPQDIDWNFNPGTAHWGHDLNRFTYLTPLTQAFVAGGDAQYARKALHLILDWINKNDIGSCFVGTPYSFGSYLNNALHCAAWARCLSTLLAHNQVPARELLRILKSLHEQMAYLEIVTHKHQGNWPTIGCQGMLEVLAAFPVFRDTDRFADYCARNISEQIAEQILPDGAQDELTPHYHWVVIRNLLVSQRNLSTLGKSLDEQTLSTLGKMVHYQQQTITPDNSKMAAFNDSDPECVPDLAGELSRAGLSHLLTSTENLGPKYFPYAGVAFLRQKPQDGDRYLAFDAGPFGRSHQHEDKLGFWLFAGGRNLLVDPGRHLYDSSEVSFRSYLNSTSAHSTILIDGLQQNSRNHRDTWIAREPIDTGWEVTADEMRARGVYDLGYGPDNAVQVVHHREIVFVQQRFWIVFDFLNGEGEHQIESRFQFAPSELKHIEDGACTTFPDGNLLLRAVSNVPFTEINIECGQKEPRSGWYSDSYGKLEPSPTLSLHTTANLPLRIATLLFPYDEATPPDVTFSFDGENAVMESEEIGKVSTHSRLW